MDLPLSKEIYQKLSPPLLQEFQGKNVLLTGGTGFIGKWFLHFFSWLRESQGLEFQLLVPTRQGEEFSKAFPTLSKGVTFFKSDIRTPFAIKSCQLDYIIHGATSTDAAAIKEDPLFCYDTVIEGTRNLLDLAKEHKVDKFLMLSSGAIYGKQSTLVSHQEEDESCSLDINNPAWVYHEAKRAAELLCSLYSKQHGIHTTMARLYAFAGPFLPLDQHFAVGNFVKDCLQDRPLVIKGDGTTLRSYMYPSDLIVWLITLLLRGKSSYAYNVGSEESVSILELAQQVQSSAKTVFKELKESHKKNSIEVLGKPTGQSPDRYVPSTQRALKELGLHCHVSTQEAIRAMIKWNLSQS